jgi:hypothetical protein
MGSAFVQAHATADLGETERCLTLAQNFENRNGALETMQLIWSVGLGINLVKRRRKGRVK